jgi:hypothetical protein
LSTAQLAATQDWLSSIEFIGYVIQALWFDPQQQCSEFSLHHNIQNGSMQWQRQLKHDINNYTSIVGIRID